MNKDIQSLIQAYLDGRLTATQAQTLRAWISTDDTHARILARYCLLHSLLRRKFVEQDLQASLQGLANAKELMFPGEDCPSAGDMDSAPNQAADEEGLPALRQFTGRKLRALLSEQEAMCRVTLPRQNPRSSVGMNLPLILQRLRKTGKLATRLVVCAGPGLPLAIIALILIGVLVTIHFRRHPHVPENGTPQTSVQNQPRQTSETHDREQSHVPPDQHQAQLQQALASYEQGRAAEFNTLFAAGTVKTQLAVIDYLASLDEPSALSLLANLATRSDLALEVRQAAALAQEPSVPRATESAEPSKPVAPDPVGTLQDIDNSAKTILGLKVIDAETGKAIPDVQCRITLHADEDYEQMLVTNIHGRCSFSHQGRDYRNLSVRLSKTGYAPQDLAWRGESLPLQQLVTLEKGVTIGGVVKTEAGIPIEGVSVSVQSQPQTPVETTYRATAGHGRSVTDKEGRWRYEHFSSRVEEVRLGLSHPEYVSVEPSSVHTTLDQLVEGSFLSVMRKGLRVTGLVINQQGDPVAHASVLSIFSGGRSFSQTETRTDASGLFCFENWRSGQTVLTVKAEYYAQACQGIIIGERMKALHFVLEPEYTLKVKVLDPDGRPIPGALIQGRYWRSEIRGLPLQDSIRVQQETNEQGMAVLRTLPADTVGYQISRQGYTGLWRYDMAGTDAERTITLWPQGRLSGRVYDQASMEPINSFTCEVLPSPGSFHVVPGESFILSPPAPAPPVTVKDNQYDMPFLYQTEGLTLKIQLPGYLPYESPTFYSDGSALIHDVYLTPGQALTGTVYESNGSPVSEAQIRIFNTNSFVLNGRFRENSRDPVIKTDHLGRFHLLPQSRKFKLMVLNDKGFAELEDVELHANPDVSLWRWGRVEGTVYSGLRPLANTSVVLRESHAGQPFDRQKINTTWMYSARTDQYGHFVLDRVRPGPVRISRVIGPDKVQDKEMRTVLAEVLPGQTVRVQIGGGGRKVSGHFVLPEVLEPEILDHGKFEVFPAPTGEPTPDMNAIVEPPVRAPYVVQLLEDQAFLIDDIEPGDYVLRANLRDPRLYSFRTMSAYHRSCIAETEYAFNVPEAHSDQAYEQIVDLGSVPVAVTAPDEE